MYYKLNNHKLSNLLSVNAYPELRSLAVLFKIKLKEFFILSFSLEIASVVFKL